MTTFSRASIGPRASKAANSGSFLARSQTWKRYNYQINFYNCFVKIGFHLPSNYNEFIVLLFNATVCHGFRLTNFGLIFSTFETNVVFEGAEAVSKIGSSQDNCYENMQ